MEITEKTLVLENSKELKKVAEFLEKSGHAVSYEMNFPGILFIQIFREQISSTILNTFEEVSRSNWTYNIAFAFLNTAKSMNFQIRFEAEGKRDAIVQSYPDANGKLTTILAAEWEWDSNDVFGKDKEIEKLYRSSKTHDCEALLFTYVESQEYQNFLIKTIETWRSLSRGNKNLAMFLCVITFKKEPGLRRFEAIRTVEIGPEDIRIWEDKFLA